MVSLRLGLPIFEGTRTCPICRRPNAVLDPYGHHASVCSTGTGSVRRHDALRDTLAIAIRNVARAFGVTVRREHMFEDPPELIQPHTPGAPLTRAQQSRAHRQSRREATGNSERASTQMRLDVYVDNVEFAARPQAFDVSVISPHSASHRVSRTAAHAHIASKEREKRIHYRSLCDYYGIDLHPMVMDVYTHP